MAVTMELRLPREAASVYDPLNAEMGVSQGNTPAGLLHHFATRTDDGFTVFDVWETREDFDRFADERLMPAMQKVAGDRFGRVEPVFGQLHNEFHG